MKGKNILVFFVLLVILVLSSCNSTSMIPKGIEAYEYPRIEAKDYVIIAPIVLKSIKSRF